MSALDVQIAVARADLILLNAWHYGKYVLSAAIAAALLCAIIKREVKRL